MTAAHCDPRDWDFRVVVGNEDLVGSGTAVDVVEKFKHQNWNRLKIQDDIMLFRLAESVSETPVTMNFDANFPDEDQAEQEELIAIGLGKTSGGATVLPENLQFVRKDVFPFDECEDLYSFTQGGFFEDIFDGFFDR